MCSLQHRFGSTLENRGSVREGFNILRCFLKVSSDEVFLVAGFRLFHKQGADNWKDRVEVVFLQQWCSRCMVDDERVFLVYVKTGMRAEMYGGVFVDMALKVMTDTL